LGNEIAGNQGKCILLVEAAGIEPAFPFALGYFTSWSITKAKPEAPDIKYEVERI
jgi:hypothetical protein